MWAVVNALTGLETDWSASEVHFNVLVPFLEQCSNVADVANESSLEVEEFLKVSGDLSW